MVVSGPVRRKSLLDSRTRCTSCEENEIIANSDVVQEADSTFVRGGSVNRYEVSMETDDSCSDVYTDDEEPVTEEKTRHNPYDGESYISKNSPSRTPSNDTRFYKPVPDSLSKKNSHYELLKSEYSTSKETENGNSFINMIILTAIAILCFCAVYSRLSKDSTVNVYSRLGKASPVKCADFYELEANYKDVDEKIWSLLNVNVRRAIAKEKREPGTILFLHNGSPIMANKFVDSVVNTTACYFDGAEPIVLNGKHIKETDYQDDYGVFVAQQSAALRQKGVLLVRNLEHIPAHLAQAFHTICDTQEPLVDRAVIYLMMDMSKASRIQRPGVYRSATAEAEYFLREIWKDSLRAEVLDPLITRLTENVFRID